MKFTQTDAAKKISGILTRGGKDQQLSDRTIAENIDSLMKALVTDETELDDFIKIVEPMFKTWQNNAKKDNSDFVDKWKEDHPENSTAVTGEQQGQRSKTSENPDLKAALERIAALEKLNEENVLKASLAQKRKDVESKLKEKGVNDAEWIELQLSKVDFNKELDLDKEADDYLKLYNKSKANGETGIVPGTPGTPPSDIAYKATIDAVRERAKKARASINPNNN